MIEATSSLHFKFPSHCEMLKLGAELTTFEINKVIARRPSLQQPNPPRGSDVVGMMEYNRNP